MNKFDELTKSLAQSVTRRGAMKKFGVGLAAAIAASFGFRAGAAPPSSGFCEAYGYFDGTFYLTGWCKDPVTCERWPTSHCKGGKLVGDKFIGDPCSTFGSALLDTSKHCSR